MQSDNAKPLAINAIFQFSLRHLLVACALVSVPLALFSIYWRSVNHTVDNRTIPFSEASVKNQFLLYVATVLVAMFAAGFIGWLLSRRQRAGAVVVLMLYVLCLPIIASLISSRIIDPEQGNAQAAIHNDAAAIAAAATERYFSRNQQWPSCWEDLYGDIESVIEDVERRQPLATPDPFATTADPFSADPAEAEESQSLFSRHPDLNELKPEDLSDMVDIDFDADLATLARANWEHFTGIVPHKPTYNTHRVELSRLIALLNQHLNDPEVE